MIDSIRRLREQIEEMLASIGADPDGPGYKAAAMFTQAPLLDVLRVLEGFAKGPDDHVLSVVSVDSTIVISCSDCGEEVVGLTHVSAHDLTWLERYHHEALEGNDDD